MKKYIVLLYVLALTSLAGCSAFLDEKPNGIIPDKVIFSDEKLIKSALANLYGRISYGQRLDDWEKFSVLDEAVRHNKDEFNGVDRNWWRIYDYELIRNVNQFIVGVNGSAVLSAEQKRSYIAEVRFIRAWNYFCSARSLGGVPLVGDEVVEYTMGMDPATLQKPRNSEAEVYDYIIKECNEIANTLSSDMTKNAGRANKWAAKMLEARAALYAASIAKYNVGHPNLVVAGGIVGIDASKAAAYYQTAYTAANDVVANSPYVLQDKKPDNKARNFFEAVSVKGGANTEVIWARDYNVPNGKHYYTKDVIPKTIRGEATSCRLAPILNLVEEYEPINATIPGQAEKFVVGTLENPVFYATASAPFETRDPRLGGTVIYPGASFNGQAIVLQAGQMVKKEGKWELVHSPYDKMGNNDPINGKLVTSLNGPIQSNDPEVNKTGFSIMKYLDENPAASTFTGSDVWCPYFRMAEAYLIAAEALVETGKATDALPFINSVRNRAGVKPLTTVTFNNIVHERRVEFAFEDQRFWDLKRWRLGDVVWNPTASTAQRRGLYPYLVVAPGDPNDGKWFFQEINMNFLYPNSLRFEDRHYYADVDQDWINKNPKLVKNPYQ